MRLCSTVLILILVLVFCSGLSLLQKEVYLMRDKEYTYLKLERQMSTDYC